MFKKRKNRDSTDELSEAVKEAVSRVCAWRDACGAFFAVETNTKVGEDFVILELRGIDELLISDLFGLADNIPYITDYSCVFAKNDAKGFISLTFENISGEKKSKKAEQDEDDTRYIEEDSEILEAHKKIPSAEENDIKISTMCFIRLKKHLCMIDALKVTFSTTSTPGLLVLGVHGLTVADKKFCESVRKICDAEKVKFEVHLEKNYAQLNIKKKKGIVNI